MQSVCDGAITRLTALVGWRLKGLTRTPAPVVVLAMLGRLAAATASETWAALPGHRSGRTPPARGQPDARTHDHSPQPHTAGSSRYVWPDRAHTPRPARRPLLAPIARPEQNTRVWAIPGIVPLG